MLHTGEPVGVWRGFKGECLHASTAYTRRVQVLRDDEPPHPGILFGLIKASVPLLYNGFDPLRLPIAKEQEDGPLNSTPRWTTFLQTEI
jgi:hypothetical protein